MDFVCNSELLRIKNGQKTPYKKQKTASSYQILPLNGLMTVLGLYPCPAAAGVMGRLCWHIADAIGKAFLLGSAPIIRLASVVEASQNDSRDF